MTKLNGLFVENGTTSNSKKALAGTAEMTAIADKVVNIVLDKLSNDFDDHEELFETSKADSNAMDALISELTNGFQDVEVDFLEKYDDEVLKNMLKSQQSKRSRAKSKEMTMDNYMAMMNAAVCELMIRTVTGKAKTRTAGRSLDMYTAEYLEQLSADQYEVRRELRNVQSKICIFKKKHPEDFADQEEYKELKRVEEILKEMRQPIEGGGLRVKMSEVTGVIDNIDPAALSLEDAQALIAKLQNITGKQEDGGETDGQ